ncbi:unnamed protein product [Auanema sp. JU1783]|nr:unnamed protein product [Auanema sp. JU1783]
MSRVGIIYNLNEYGTARIILHENHSAMEGVLETVGGETIVLKGKHNTNIPSTSSNGIVNMDVMIVDGEAGSLFEVHDVDVYFGGNTISIDNGAIKFTTKERLIGIKAETEIRQFLRPSLGKETKEVYVGPMRIQLLAKHVLQPSIRRESVSDKCDIPILEQSDDFLA